MIKIIQNETKTAYNPERFLKNQFITCDFNLNRHNSIYSTRRKIVQSKWDINLAKIRNHTNDSIKNLKFSGKFDPSNTTTNIRPLKKNSDNHEDPFLLIDNKFLTFENKLYDEMNTNNDK